MAGPVRNIVTLRSKAIVFSFKHRISEVFTSGDVSLQNIVIFLSYNLLHCSVITLFIESFEHDHGGACCLIGFVVLK